MRCQKALGLNLYAIELLSPAVPKRSGDDADVANNESVDCAVEVCDRGVGLVVIVRRLGRRR
jgi:cobalamin biosynthesis protein CbiD